MILEFKDPQDDVSLDITKVKNQYLELVKKYHPDTVDTAVTSKEEATKKFLGIKAAYDKLIEMDEGTTG